MKKLKVMTIVGTRPEIIRLSRVLVRLDNHCEHIIVHTGQNYDYELNRVFFEDLDIREPNFFLNSAVESTGVSEKIGRVIIGIDQLLEKIKPEAVLVLGDTNSCLSVIAAKRRKIPIFHMEAGNRCFDMRVPEETNRRIVDHIADVNLTYSSIARDYLIPEISQEYCMPNVAWTNELILETIQRTETEEGVRNLKRNLDKIYSKLNLLQITENKKTELTSSLIEEWFPKPVETYSSMYL
jgi:UDP-N-acetylglucosamine 2-epimerase